MLFSFAVSETYAPLMGTLLVLFGALGAVALASPRLFSTLAQAGNRWIDTSRFFAKLDTRVEVDSRVLPYSRILGGAVVIAVSALALVLYQ